MFPVQASKNAKEGVCWVLSPESLRKYRLVAGTEKKKDIRRQELLFETQGGSLCRWPGISYHQGVTSSMI